MVPKRNFFLSEKLSREEREEGNIFAPVFNEDGLLPVTVTHASNNDVLMLAYMNKEALQKTLESGEAHYWSRSRQALWHKGATSGQIQEVREMRIDCDQDSLWLKVLPHGDGGCCHMGYSRCFYRRIDGDSLKTSDRKISTPNVP